MSKWLLNLRLFSSKGPDRVTLESRSPNNRDEVQIFLDARYISTSESMWRLFGFLLSEKYPPVLKIPIHLEGEQSVIYRDTDDISETLQKFEKTALTEFFTLCQQDPAARKFTYPEILRHYTWHKDKKKWLVRKRNMCRTINTDENDVDSPKSETIGESYENFEHKSALVKYQFQSELIHI